MEDGVGLWLILLSVIFFGMPTAICCARRSRPTLSPIGRPSGSGTHGSGISEAARDSQKSRIVEQVLDAVVRSITSNLESTQIVLHPGDPDDVITFIMDIDQFRHMRKRRSLWEHQGMFAEREIERRWSRRPPTVREWEGIELIIPIIVETAFEAGPGIWTVRVWIGDMEKDALTICRVSVEAHDDEDESGEYDWRFDKRAKGYLAPVTPHGDRIPQLAAVGLAQDPYDFEQQVAQMLRSRGMVTEVTGGPGDEGVDIIAYDDTPLTGGVYLVQCKRYSPDHKVGVSEVRELYGTMQEKQSAKGVLVTSSGFTAGALRFAEGKSIELIDGGRLSELVAAAIQPVPDAFLEAEYDFSPAAETPTASEAVGGLGELMRQTSADLNQAAFFLAADEGDLEALEQTILDDANINGRHKGGASALSLAIHSGHTAVVKLLIAHGVDVDLASETGFTPLHMAVGFSRPEIVDLLVNTGANVDALSNDGLCPLDGCIWRITQPDARQDDFDILVQLVRAGADTTSARRLALEAGLSDAVLDLLR